MAFILKSTGLVLLYLAAAKVGLVFGTVSGTVTIFWPSGGIALAALLLGGLRFLPIVLVASWLTTIFLVEVPVGFAFGAAIGNALETWLGYFLLTQYGRINLTINRLRDLFLILMLGGLIPAIASATFGPLSFWAAGLIPADILPKVMWSWWRGNVLGIVFITPLVLLFAKKKPYHLNANTAWEPLSLWLLAIAVGQMVFLGWRPLVLASDHVPSLAWIFPLIIWAGLRTGRRNTALIQLLFMAQALASAHLRLGVFADEFARYGLANFWMFALLLAVMGMALAVMSEEERKARQQTALHAKVFAVSTHGVVIVNERGNIEAVNTAFTNITGYTAHEAIGKNPRLYSSGMHGRDFYAAMWNSLRETGEWEGKIWNRRKDGETFLEQLSIQTITDSHNRVLNRIGIFSDITQAKAELDAVAHQAQHDFLTGLPNRLLFSDRFSQHLAMAKRRDMKFAVIYLDLDRFKAVNDQHGHAVGDHLLMAVANRLSALVREVDTVCRFGGDEYALLVSEVTQEQDVTTLADKIVATLAQPFILGGHTMSVSASLGIALYPQHGADMEAIMHRADAALYNAKHQGKNAWVMATAD